MMALLLAAAAVAIPADSVTVGSSTIEKYLIHISGGGLGIMTDDTISISRIGRRWIAERLVKDYNWCGQKSGDRSNSCIETNVVRHEWVDGRTCPALSQAMVKIADAWRSDEAIPENMKQKASDTPEFTIIARSDSKKTLGDKQAAEFLGPLATWWRNTEADIHGCWSVAAPVSIEPRLSAAGV